MERNEILEQLKREYEQVKCESTKRSDYGVALAGAIDLLTNYKEEKPHVKMRYTGSFEADCCGVCFYECSGCGQSTTSEGLYCPHCGAEVDEYVYSTYTVVPKAKRVVPEEQRQPKSLVIAPPPSLENKEGDIK